MFINNRTSSLQFQEVANLFIKISANLKTLILIIFLALSNISPVQADDNAMSVKIVTLLHNYLNLPAQARPSLHIELLTPPSQLATLCAEPELSLSGNLNRLAGVHSIIAQCATQRRFIQIHVDATATRWQATHALRAGQTINPDDIRPQRGSLEHLPGGLILDPKRIIGRVTLRAIHPGENLVESQLRQQWAITVGQKVEMTYRGRGFKISATGKALDNAALNGHFRIKTASGQIVTATAIACGKAAVAEG